jgi:hypothetical protein
MTDAEYAEQKARVERYTNGWGHILEMGGWHVEVCWHREKDDENTDANLRPAMMKAESRWQYADLTVHVYLPSVIEVDDDAKLEQIVVHEYMHAFLNEMRPMMDQTIPVEEALGKEHLRHEEHTATMLAKAFIWVRDKAGNERAERQPDGSPGKSEAV